MSTEAAERHRAIAATIPGLHSPLRTDPKPRAVYPYGLDVLAERVKREAQLRAAIAVAGST